MKQYTIHILCSWLGSHLINVHPGTGAPDFSRGIFLLEGTETSCPPGHLYIGDQAAILAVIKRLHPLQPVCMISSGQFSPQDALSLPDQIWLLETDLSLLPLFNHIQQKISVFYRWVEEIGNIILKDEGLDALIESAGKKLSATILLVNAGYKCLSAYYDPEVHDAVALELKANDYLSYSTICQIQRPAPLSGGKDHDYKAFRDKSTGNHFIIWKIRENDAVHARLIVITPPKIFGASHFDMTELAKDFISECFFSKKQPSYDGNPEFGSLVSDLLEFRLTNKEEAIERIKNVKLSVRRFYHIILISFPSQDKDITIPWNYIINNLKMIFPYCDITTYCGDIFLMIRKEKPGPRLQFDENSLENLLSEYGGKAAVGNFSEFLTSMPPIYYQTKAALRLGQAIDPKKHIYFYEDYSLYHLVELANIGAHSQLFSRNIVYLCHPALISLIQYDRKNGADLTKILFTYLRNDRNSSQTASELYMHRNTMLNKVRKIEEIIGQSLEDPGLRERLIFSYYVLEYMEKYEKGDILTLKQNKKET